MKIATIACLGLTSFVALTGAASAASVRPTTYPVRCDARAASWGETDRVCYYFAMREAYGDSGFVSPFASAGPEGFADPRAWRFTRVVRVHRVHRR